MDIEHMIDFKEWFNKFENLQLVKTIEPSAFAQKHLIRDKKNPEQIKSFKKNLSINVFSFPLAKDSFIHFTRLENIPEILKTKILGKDTDSVNFAVSTSFGYWYPRVQFTHIKYDPKIKRSEQIGAILFKTNAKPTSATGEEIYWEHPVPLLDAKQIDTRIAINILKHTPFKLGPSYSDWVEYF